MIPVPVMVPVMVLVPVPVTVPVPVRLVVDGSGGDYGSGWLWFGYW